MSPPVLPYAGPNDTASKTEARRQDDHWWLLGLLIGFFAPFGLLVAIGFTQEYTRLGRLAAPLELLAALALFILIAAHQHKRYHSWSFIRGAIIGAILPVGIAAALIARGFR